MGEHEDRLLPRDLVVLNGLLGDEVANAARVLDKERWLRAEERTADLLACIQPDLPSEERRNAVVDYVQRLIMNRFSCEIFTYGSVPLKTYLPDGDIDLTVFGENEDLKGIRKVLENEEKSENAKFCVKEVQYIQAEVKIIKCLVENIVVDISFNQVGGLCTLCFLEQIDHLISQNHLFKRSIILIKAWCYYESRILGAHHGLISTYALETLILYIFHAFNNSFTGPLEVLYRFLEFFSRFNWDNFCVSLWGPIPISSLPDMTAESPLKDGGELLLTGRLLEVCSTHYTVLPGGQESQGQQFVSKHFNVVDPLRTNNNLGRSVSKGNFYRIRSAFAFGEKSLAKLLDCPKEDLIAEVNQFFMNTWQRRSANRADAPAPAIRYLQPVKDGPAEESSHSRGSANLVKSTECFPNAYRTTKSSMESLSLRQNFCTNTIGSSNFDHMERANYSNQEEQGSYSFARTQSSSVMSETPADDHSRTRHGRVVQAGGSRRKNTNLDSSNIQTVMVSFDVAPQSDIVLKSYPDNTSFTTVDKEVASVYEALELQQQEQEDMINKIASLQAHNFIGQVQIPMHFTSPHPPLPLPPFQASIGYGQRNFVTWIDPSLGSTMQFPQGFISSQPPQYISNVDTQKSNFEELTVNERSCVTLLNQESRNIGSTRCLITDTEESQTLQFDERQHSSAGHFNYAHSSRLSNSGATENNDCPNTFQQQNSGANGIIIDDRNVNMRHIPMTQVRDGPNHTKSTRYNCGRNPSTSEVENSALENEQSEWEFEAAAKAASSQEDDESGNWISTTISTTSMPEHAVSYAPLAFSHSRSQLPGYYAQAHISGANSIIPLAPMLLGDSQQKMVDGSGVLPFSFHPAGPPVPFLTMVPVCNFSDDRAIFDNSTNQVENGNGVRHFRASPSGENFNPADNYDQFDHLMNLSISEGAAPSSSEEHRPDVLNSDFAIHTPSHGPFIYSSPSLVPPAYLHGHFPMNGPGRPYSANRNFTQIMSYAPRLVPVASLQAGYSRPYGIYNRYGDESRRYQGGTGTYLPSPASFREREFSNARNQRGGYRHDRGYQADGERTRINSKARSPGRYHSSN
ncbi:hypothetical protein KSP39_PZI015257 [Platanthera zijinensis]|uniref:Polymerase nucleotidyl transferase domain-containing protein n=1 Tax=Platanthera zijinensis TaxID=2320716 RepID=A0AAP0B928_9ASPA